MTSTENFWDKVAEKYSRQPIKDMDAYNQTLERVRHHLSAEDEVLEIGCGTGSTALLLADGVKRITASDISSNMIDIAKEKGRNQQVENVDFVQATPFDAVLENKSYDVVLAFNLLHLFEDAPAAVRRVGALLKPGGLFISKTPCLAERSSMLALMVPIMRVFGKAPSCVKFLSVPEVEACIANENFEIIETGSYPAAPASRFVVARKNP